MSAPFLTVIIPVYNTEKYLVQCLESVLAQTFTDVEFLCIDDGSTDGSPQILDKYLPKDARLKVIHKVNGGLVSVRKLGVEKAAGKYIGFVDSDDWIDPEMYERLCDAAMKNDADLVSSNYRQEGAYSSVSQDAVEAGVYGGSKIANLRDRMILDLNKHDKGLSGSLCTKIFRASFMKNIMPSIPNEIRVSEDKVTSLTFLLECSTAVILDDAYYHYRINHESMFHADDPDYLLNYHYVYNYFRKLYSHKNFTEHMRTQAELYIVQFLIKGINTQMGFSFRNLMWIDPDWIKAPDLGKRIALYGGGDLGKTYEKHIAESDDKSFCGYVEGDSIPDNYDSIVITIKNQDTSEEVRKKLINLGVNPKDIFWFKQEEIFWKYADAMGLNREK